MILPVNKEHKKHPETDAATVAWCIDELAILNDTLIEKKGSGLLVSPLYGLILCGGKSTRMGTDKSGILYHDKSQREHMYELLADLCEATFLSYNHQQADAVHQLPFIEDAIQGLGPAGGILSAFQYNREVAWLTIACDLPYLNKETIQQLIKYRNPAKTATAFWDAEGKFPEPLVTIWEPKTYSLLLQFISKGYSCPRKVLINSEVEMITALDTSVFANINTMQESKEVFFKMNKK